MITKEYLLDPKNENHLILKIGSMGNRQRRKDAILKFNGVNPLLAAKCLLGIRRTEKELQAQIKQQAQQHIERAENPDSLRRAILALFELKELNTISQIFAQIKNPENTFYRRVIQDMIRANSDHSDFLFSFLDILFENHQKSTQPHTHELWIWALESLPDDMFISGYQTRLKEFYHFFAVQNHYSPSLHLLPEKANALLKSFQDILIQHQKLTGLQKMYLNVIRRNPAKMWDYIAEIKLTAIPLNTVLYNRFIHYAANYQQGFDLFEEMKKAGLKIDEISYNTLINKAQTYQQGFDLFEDMKKAGLTPNEISYSTLINKAQTYQQGFDLFEEMKQAGLKIDEISYSTLINKAQTYQQSFELFEDMKQAGLTPNEISYSTCLLYTSPSPRDS